MLGMKNRERELYERLITVMADQIDWLRVQARMQPPLTIVNPDSDTDEDRLFDQIGKMYLDEDEEMIASEMRSGALDIATAESLLAQVQALNTEVHFAD